MEKEEKVMDMLGRPISVGDYVVSYNNLYQVLALSKRSVRMILVKKSKTTKPVMHDGRHICIVPTADVVFWTLKKHY